MKYKQKKISKNRENETLSKLSVFKNKINNQKKEKTGWLSKNLKFHVDSQRAYEVNEAADYNSSLGININRPSAIG